ncbi:M20 metallopeptidase family protein [Dactylosporangium fulvum]|uniref:M20/M25/M40 family metallo-hydrolase n=1 Tax=Dactylosporangium fulvum TaxID=53359 RepID=A0ABY5VSM0_9ACTN|nr:M20/M25/M40 family metallo-hydrolase [Dactylosporangium fulvum]UWP80195.1 M20/M25/M40 family metallo-hydrolase [Dactylosporangium fulvum]
MTAVPNASVIDQIAVHFDADLIALRRDLHRWPELAGDERRTASAVAERLRAAGLSVSTGIGGHGVVAVLDGAGLGPTVAYRADMDAVAADELAGGEFASQVPGAAHLCGHDLHTTIGVGIAETLSRLRHRFSGRVVFVFQPAEETLDGARAMIDAGLLNWAAPEEMYALHCSPLPVGAFAVMPGAGQPGLDVGHIDVSGPNAADTGAQLVASINDMSTVTEPQTPEEFAQLLNDLQATDGPLARFVFTGALLTPADDGAVRVQFWLRTWPDDRYPALREDVRRLAHSVGATRVEFPQPPFPSMVCSPELSRAAATHLRGVPGVSTVEVFHAPFPFNGEDFALFLRRVPGAMFFLGVANPDAGVNGLPHAPGFAADERAIGLGVRAMTGLLLSRLHTLHR